MKQKNDLKNRELEQLRPLISEAYSLMHTDPEKCIMLSRKALKISRKHKHNIGIGMSYMHIGLGHFHQSDYYNANKNYLLAEPYFQQEKYWYGLRSIYNNIGLVYAQWDDLGKALEFYQKNLELEARFNDPKLSSTILNNIGRIYLQQEDYSKAIEYFRNVRSICIKYDLPYMNSVAADNLGIVYMRIGKLQQAEKIFNESEVLKIQIKDHAGLSRVYDHLALLKAENGDYEKALKFLQKALNLTQQVNEYSIMANIYFNFADIYERTGKTSEQLHYLDKCLKLAESNKLYSILLKVSAKLAEFHESNSQFEAALKYYKKMQSIKDYFSDEKKTRTYQEIKTKMEVERTEREKDILQKKNAELKEKNQEIRRQKVTLEKTDKELKELNQTLEKRVQEETAKRLQQEQIIIQKSKLESLGQLAAGIAHEINQPIGLIKIAAQNLFHKFENSKITTAYLQEKSAFFEENINRIAQIIEHIRLFSRDQQVGGRHKFDVVQTLDKALSMVNMQFKNHNINLIREFPAGKLEVLGNKYRLEQVIVNLLFNAKDALEEKFDEFDDAKMIIVRTFSKGKKVFIQLEDNGCGIDEKTLELAFDPFFTTKSESKGTGLGLSICYGIIKDMAGKISLKSEKGKFTTATIELDQVN